VAIWTDKRLKVLSEELAEATTYPAWRQVAAAIDEHTGAAAWRADDRSEHLDGLRLREDIARMSTLQVRGDATELAGLLHGSLHETIGDLTHAPLYNIALTGTKHIIDDYLDAVEGALNWLASTPNLSEPQKRALVEQADRVHGRPALLLSGGATLGFYHIGVVKALWRAGILPGVLCGASMGAMVAAGIATRTDDELEEMWDDPNAIRRIGLQWAGLRQALAQGAAMDPAVMQQTVRHNVGRWSFQQAHARTGRVLGISISPVRAGQSPRVLSHLTAPDALICQAALASGAIPLAFPPVTLTALDASGQEVPYLPGEAWMDGSMHGDLPKMRLARLHNVNRFIVSQTNPHVLPFLGLRSRRGVLPSVTRLLAKSAWTQSQQAFQLTAKLAEPTPLSGWADLAAHATRQEWRGDIDIHPRFRWRLYRRVFSNPSAEDLDLFIADGERATWPRIETIRQHTRLSRMLQATRRQLDAPASARSAR
jgi:TAG lipase/steryl ester hydrolase/phospholipase A2/LPA acyltransferase